MADGFTDLEEKIMVILVQERKTASHTIADAHEIAGFLEAENAKLRAEARGASDAHRKAFAANDKLIQERDCLLLQVSELRSALVKIREIGFRANPFDVGAGIALAALAEKPVSEKSCGINIGDGNHCAFLKPCPDHGDLPTIEDLLGECRECNRLVRDCGNHGPVTEKRINECPHPNTTNFTGPCRACGDE